MLLSRIDHDDRFGLSAHGRHGEELGRARHAPNVADNTRQEYSNASHSRQQAQRGITGALQGVSPGCPRTLLALSSHGRPLLFHSVRFVGCNYLRAELHGAITLACGQ